MPSTGNPYLGPLPLHTECRYRLPCGGSSGSDTEMRYKALSNHTTDANLGSNFSVIEFVTFTRLACTTACSALNPSMKVKCSPSPPYVTVEMSKNIANISVACRAPSGQGPYTAATKSDSRRLCLPRSPLPGTRTARFGLYASTSFSGVSTPHHGNIEASPKAPRSGEQPSQLCDTS